MKNKSFSKEELLILDMHCAHMKLLKDCMDRVKTFTEGDYLVAMKANVATGKDKAINDSYGVPLKYKIVHIDEHGIPWIKRINSLGYPKGSIINLVVAEMREYIAHVDDIGGIFSNPATQTKFVLDPDYVDSLILGPSAYDPVVRKKTASEVWKDIVKYNSSHKIRTTTLNHVVNFFKTIKAGDQFWTSHKRYFTVTNIKTKSSRGTASRVKGPHITQLDVVFSDGRARTLYPDDLIRKALYSAPPRSHRKEINPNL
jgi:hypothetical protein